MSESSLGSVELAPATDVVAGTFGTWRVTYTAGSQGIAPGGCFVLARAWPADWGTPQWEDPAGPHYTTLKTTGACRLSARFELRTDPLWNPHACHALFVDIHDRSLQPGEQVAVTFGDTAGGSPGLQAQTFLEEESRLYVAVDSQGDGEWQALAALPTLRVRGGPACRLVVIAPSLVVAGEEFRVLIRAEDRWRNPDPDFAGAVRLWAEGQPAVTSRFAPDDAGALRLTYRLAEPGEYRLHVTDEAQFLAAESNPVLCQPVAPKWRLFWGDLHGQSRLGCGARSVANYLRHARDVAGVDCAGDQANDHYLTDEQWLETQRVTQALHDPGRFVTLLGYEWSGESDAGGDHNIYFPNDSASIRRSSHSLVKAAGGAETDLAHIADVYAWLKGSEAIVVPHVGGRTADLAYHAAALTPLIEVHSTHATSEWFLRAALERGHRVGFIAGSDDIMGRPGASHPGNHIGRNVRGGLAAIYARDLSRASLWEALRARRCYATTGARLLLDVTADGHVMGEEYATQAAPAIEVRVVGTAELEAVELFRGSHIVYSRTPWQDAAPHPDWIRLLWSGASEPGSAMKARLVWDGTLTLDAGRILEAVACACISPAVDIVETTAQQVRWRAYTAGNRAGLLLHIAAPDAATFEFDTAPSKFSFHLNELSAGPKIVEAGPVDRRVVVSRVPAGAGPRHIEFRFVDDRIEPGVHPYFVRVTQTDGEQAWSSPIYVHLEAS